MWSSVLTYQCGPEKFNDSIKVTQKINSRVRALFSSVRSLSPVRLFAAPWIVALQASLSITNSWSLLKLMFIELVMPSNHLILCPPLLLLPSIFPSIGVFSKAYFNVIYLLFLKGHLKDMKIHLSFPWHSGILPSLMKTSNFLSV